MSKKTEPYLYHWPIASPSGVVLILHGLGEYGGRYAHVAQFFNERNLAAMAVDFPGHGHSPGPRGHARGLEHLFQYIDYLMQQATEHYPDVIKVLYGHSMGGNAALNYLIRKKPSIAALITSSAWIRLPQAPPIVKVLAAKVMRYIWPSLTLPNGLDVSGLSRDEDVVARYMTDPLVHDRISTALGASMLEAAQFLDQWQGSIDVPVLLIHGDADRITAYQGSFDFAERVRGPVTCQVWAGGYHELHNEPEKGKVLHSVYKWLERKVLSDK